MATNIYNSLYQQQAAQMYNQATMNVTYTSASTTSALTNVFYPQSIKVVSNTPELKLEQKVTPDEFTWLRKRVKEIEWRA